MSLAHRYVLRVDAKGRICLPAEIRETGAFSGIVTAELDVHDLVIKSLPPMHNPVQFLSTIHVKTKKTPVEMKREAEEVFGA